MGLYQPAVDGRFGHGVGQRSYEFIFDGMYLVVKHASVRLPQEKSPEGDHHRELAIYSFDRERQKIVLREFIVEGYVLRYVCEVDPKRFVCTSESIESGSEMRARLTIDVPDAYHFDEIFELAPAGQDLTPYFNIRWTRIPDLSN